MSTLRFEVIEDDKKYDEIVLSMPNYSFLNSSFRYRYLVNNNVDVFRYAVQKGGKVIGVINGSITTTKLFGKYMECKHSPILKEGDKEIWIEVMNFCKKLAKDNGCFMFRMSPQYERNEALEYAYSFLKAVKSPIQDIDAMITQYIDTSLPDERLRHDMTDSTRNTINKLLKNTDISIKTFNDNSQFRVFENFHEQTMRKKGYQDKPTEMLLRELQIQVDSGACYMVVGYFKGEPISIWQCTHFGKYLHVYQAGSDTQFRDKNIRITYLLFWECVKLARQLGCRALDLFGGMTPVGYKGKRHPWVGVNAFKESLGGYKVTYMHSRDIPINIIKYLPFYLYSYLRTVLKGYPINW
jgi:lipid II:glycine glycyltransferase (peptidoglycan interpeptide bridge formation enzyme)